MSAATSAQITPSAPAPSSQAVTTKNTTTWNRRNVSIIVCATALMITCVALAALTKGASLVLIVPILRSANKMIQDPTLSLYDVFLYAIFNAKPEVNLKPNKLALTSTNQPVKTTDTNAKPPLTPPVSKKDSPAREIIKFFTLERGPSRKELEESLQVDYKTSTQFFNFWTPCSTIEISHRYFAVNASTENTNADPGFHTSIHDTAYTRYLENHASSKESLNQAYEELEKIGETIIAKNPNNRQLAERIRANLEMASKAKDVFSSRLSEATATDDLQSEKEIQLNFGKTVLTTTETQFHAAIDSMFYD